MTLLCIPLHYAEEGPCIAQCSQYHTRSMMSLALQQQLSTKTNKTLWLTRPDKHYQLFKKNNSMHFYEIIALFKEGSMMKSRKDKSLKSISLRSSFTIWKLKNIYGIWALFCHLMLRISQALFLKNWKVEWFFGFRTFLIQQFSYQKILFFTFWKTTIIHCLI